MNTETCKLISNANMIGGDKYDRAGFLSLTGLKLHSVS